MWLLFLLEAATSCFAKDFIVRNAAEVSAALRQASPGDTVVLSEGTWKDQYLQLTGHGKKDAPITMRPQVKGKVVLTGNSRLDISGSWLVAEGLRFENGALEQGKHVVRFTGGKGDATDSRFTNSTISSYNPSNSEIRYFWVALYGKRNQVDHCRFEGQNHAGVTIAVMRDRDERDEHLIEYNYFINRPRRARNGGESIRIGTGDHSSSSSATVVQHNLFERTNSDLEIVSVKSSDNIIRFNTFRQAEGTVTLRQGHHNKIIGNFFLGDKAERTGGIRVTGDDHLIVNNILQDLAGAEGGGIVLICGHRKDQKATYTTVRRVVIAHNTLVNIKGALLKLNNRCEIESQARLPENLTIINNLMVNSEGQLVDGEEGFGWVLAGNMGYNSTAEAKQRSGLRIVEPRLRKEEGGVWRPDSNSLAINAAVANSFVIDDIDGQPRDSLFDVGADEISPAPVFNKPLTANQVGPRY
jgi:poly(beta-D-mannuronate) lyase